MSIRYGIIGAGMMGHEHIRNLALLPGAEVTALADPDVGMRDQALALAGGDCRAFEDHGPLLASGLCDAVVVAAPNHLHFPILKDVLASDLPVLAEKPLGISGDECRLMARWTEERKAPVWVAMEYRYMPAVARLIESARDGDAGRLRMLAIREHRFPFLKKVGNWNRFNDQTGGTLVEKCCHFFDLMRLLLGSRPRRVYASGAMDVNFLDERYGGRKPDIIDNAYVVVDFENGARAMLDLCMFAEGAPWQETITLTGDEAQLEARVPGPPRFRPAGEDRHSEFSISNRGDQLRICEKAEVDQRVLDAGDHHGSTFFQHEKFLAMVRDGGAPEVTVRDGMAAVLVGEAAERSARTGEVVMLNAEDFEVGHA